MRIAQKLLSAVLAMLPVLGTFAVGGAGLALTASAADGGKAIRLVTNGAAGGIAGAQTSSVWFGNYKQSSDGMGGYNVDPVKWRVLSNADGKLFLLADRNLDVFEYNKENTSVTWETSDMRSWLNGYGASANSGRNNYAADSFRGDAFTAAEFAAVADSELVNANNPDYGTSGGNNTTDKVFLLSIAEATNTAYGFTAGYDAADTRIATNTSYAAGGGKVGRSGMNSAGGADYWWLRSPGSSDKTASVVIRTGNCISGGGLVNNDNIAVRPAVNIDLGKVLFVSSAVGGKQGVGLTAVGDAGSDWKLTLLDDSRSAFTASCTKDNNGVRTIVYSGATTGENEKISAVIVDADGVVTYYGVLDAAQSGKNTLKVDVSGKLADGDTLYVFNEQTNGNKKTDCASALVDVTTVTEAPAAKRTINLVTNGKADYITGAQTSNIWFGNYKQSSDGNGGFNVNPIRWRVLQNKDGKLFLLSDKNLYASAYNQVAFRVTWETCDMRSWLNGYDASANSDGIDYTHDSFQGDAFTAEEFAAVADSELVNADNPDYGTSGGNNTTDKVFLLSIAEATNTAYGFTDNYDPTDTRVSTNTSYAAGGHAGDGISGAGRPDDWWLRSPGDAPFTVARVSFLGELEIDGMYLQNANAVRPALNVDLRKVLFTSAAVGGKTGSGLTAVGDYDGSDWKLTLLDDSRSAFTVSLASAQNGVYTIDYSGATTGENEKISAMIVDEDGAVTYYGALCEAEMGEHTVTVDLNGKLNEGDKLYVFNEQANGDKKTDYASALVDVTPTVMPALFTNKAELKTGLNTYAAQTVWYGGSQWRAIGYDGAGVASEEGTMTLFANAGMGTAYFDFDGRTRKQYSGSDLQKQTNQIGYNAFSDPEQLAVRERTLDAGTYNGINTDGVEGSSVGYARLWPLSTKEAYAVNVGLRKDSGAWWLRSPGDGDNNVAFVKKEGNVDHIGQSFRSECGVRPAFRVDLDRVILASAAVGGKQGDGALTPVEEVIHSEWKLTLWEGNHRWFRVTETEAAAYPGETVTLHYQYAETGENEYISAVLTDASGSALYYGRLAQATAEDGAVEIAIPAGLVSGSYTLRVFNEQVNGDRMTDYASDLFDVALTVIPGVYRKPGDVDSDGEVDLGDVALLTRYLAGGWNVTVDETTADVNKDGILDLKDVVLIRRFLAGGWNVKLK